MLLFNGSLKRMHVFVITEKLRNDQQKRLPCFYGDHEAPNGTNSFVMIALLFTTILFIDRR